MKELMCEYFMRVIKFLKEPKIMALQDNPDMQEILEKLTQTLKVQELSCETEMAVSESHQTLASQSNDDINNRVEMDEDIEVSLAKKNHSIEFLTYEFFSGTYQICFRVLLIQ